MIFDAPTDGSDQLRYLATKDTAPLVDLWRQSGEAAYVAAMRDRFLGRWTLTVVDRCSVRVVRPPRVRRRRF